MTFFDSARRVAFVAKVSLPVVASSEEACCVPRRPVQPRATRPFVRLFKALGDDTRLQILGLIAASGVEELCVCDIEAHFDLSQPTISHHLKILKEAEILTAERRGTWVYYALNRGVLRLFTEFRELLGG